jgi:isoaspartyl peptidase/L-asparaginase-like protein (Ntn-hydrolase superfamily)
MPVYIFVAFDSLGRLSTAVTGECADYEAALRVADSLLAGAGWVEIWTDEQRVGTAQPRPYPFH